MHIDVCPQQICQWLLTKFISYFTKSFNPYSLMRPLTHQQYYWSQESAEHVLVWCAKNEQTDRNASQVLMHKMKMWGNSICSGQQKSLLTAGHLFNALNAHSEIIECKGSCSIRSCLVYRSLPGKRPWRSTITINFQRTGLLPGILGAYRM